MKKSFFSLSLSAFCLLNADQNIEQNQNQGVMQTRIALLNTVQREAENLIWKTKLNPDESQLLLNYSCITYALELAQRKLLQEAQFIFPMAWHMRYETQGAVINTENLLMVERSALRFSNLYKTLVILNTAQKELTNQSAFAHNKKLNEIVKQAELLKYYLINCFSNQEHNEIQQTLADAKNILLSASDVITMNGGTCKSLSENTYPLTGAPVSGKSFEPIQTAEYLVPGLARQIYEVVQATNLIENKGKDLEEFGSLVYYVFYKVIHDDMKQRGVDDHYFGMLFENNILICTDPKTRTLKEPIFDTNIPFFTH